MQQQAPSRRRSPWVRYAPFIVIVVIVAIVVVAVATSGDDDSEPSVNVGGNGDQASTLPVLYTDAQADENEGDYTWQDNCNLETGRVAIPILDAPPCVPKFTGDNGGATSPGVTADTVKIGYYIAKPDPIGDALARQTGAYDTPANTVKSVESYLQIYSNLYELYGRKIELVRIDGTGGIADAVQARNDADTAAAAGVFAVLGGPAQAKQFSDELAQKKVLCVGTCIIAQPQKYYLDNAPYMQPGNPSPDQTSSMVTEFIQKQLIGKPAQWAGPDQVGKERTFTLLTYDTPDGQYKSSWDDLKEKMAQVGANVKAHVNYYLNFATLEADARTIAAKLQQENATSILFTGDPLFPSFLTEEMTKNGYFPEWVMSGTVFADTNVFARSFDQEQWKHAFGLALVPAANKIPRTKQAAYTLHDWWYGTPPPSENNFAVIDANMQLLFSGLQTAGPNLTPETFDAALEALPPDVPPDQPTLRVISTYGDHGLWPGLPDDPAGLDNGGVLWWDPEAEGPDETGDVGKGMYRIMDGGRRYLAGQWPTEPMPLFDPEGTVTGYGDNDIPPELLPPQIPRPPNAPANNGGG
jgi:hypothetical protein